MELGEWMNRALGDWLDHPTKELIALLLGNLCQHHSVTVESLRSAVQSCADQELLASCGEYDARKPGMHTLALFAQQKSKASSNIDLLDLGRSLVQSCGNADLADFRLFMCILRRESKSKMQIPAEVLYAAADEIMSSTVDSSLKTGPLRSSGTECSLFSALLFNIDQDRDCPSNLLKDEQTASSAADPSVKSSTGVSADNKEIANISPDSDDAETVANMNNVLEGICSKAETDDCPPHLNNLQTSVIEVGEIRQLPAGGIIACQRPPLAAEGGSGATVERLKDIGSLPIRPKDSSMLALEDSSDLSYVLQQAELLRKKLQEAMQPDVQFSSPHQSHDSSGQALVPAPVATGTHTKKTAQTAARMLAERDCPDCPAPQSLQFCKSREHTTAELPCHQAVPTDWKQQAGQAPKHTPDSSRVAPSEDCCSITSSGESCDSQPALECKTGIEHVCWNADAGNFVRHNVTIELLQLSLPSLTERDAASKCWLSCHLHTPEDQDTTAAHQTEDLDVKKLIPLRCSIHHDIFTPGDRPLSNTAIDETSLHFQIWMRNAANASNLAATASIPMLELMNQPQSQPPSEPLYHQSNSTCLIKMVPVWNAEAAETPVCQLAELKIRCQYIIAETRTQTAITSEVPSEADEGMPWFSLRVKDIQGCGLLDAVEEAILCSDEGSVKLGQAKQHGPRTYVTIRAPSCLDSVVMTSGVNPRSFCPQWDVDQTLPVLASKSAVADLLSSQVMTVSVWQKSSDERHANSSDICLGQSVIPLINLLSSEAACIQVPLTYQSHIRRKQVGVISACISLEDSGNPRQAVRPIAACLPLQTKIPGIISKAAKKRQLLLLTIGNFKCSLPAEASKFSQGPYILEYRLPGAHRELQLKVQWTTDSEKEPDVQTRLELDVPVLSNQTFSGDALPVLLCSNLHMQIKDSCGATIGRGHLNLWPSKTMRQKLQESRKCAYPVKNGVSFFWSGCKTLKGAAVSFRATISVGNLEPLIKSTREWSIAANERFSDEGVEHPPIQLLPANEPLEIGAKKEPLTTRPLDLDVPVTFLDNKSCTSGANSSNVTHKVSPSASHTSLSTTANMVGHRGESVSPRDVRPTPMGSHQGQLKRTGLTLDIMQLSVHRSSAIDAAGNALHSAQVEASGPAVWRHTMLTESAPLLESSATEDLSASWCHSFQAQDTSAVVDFKVFSRDALHEPGQIFQTFPETLLGTAHLDLKDVLTDCVPSMDVPLTGDRHTVVGSLSLCFTYCLPAADSPHFMSGQPQGLTSHEDLKLQHLKAGSMRDDTWQSTALAESDSSSVCLEADQTPSPDLPVQLGISSPASSGKGEDCLLLQSTASKELDLQSDDSYSIQNELHVGEDSDVELDRLVALVSAPGFGIALDSGSSEVEVDHHLNSPRAHEGSTWQGITGSAASPIHEETMKNSGADRVSQEDSEMLEYDFLGSLWDINFSTPGQACNSPEISQPLRGVAQEAALAWHHRFISNSKEVATQTDLGPTTLVQPSHLKTLSESGDEEQECAAALAMESDSSDESSIATFVPFEVEKVSVDHANVNEDWMFTIGRASPQAFCAGKKCEDLADLGTSPRSANGTNISEKVHGNDPAGADAVQSQLNQVENCAALQHETKTSGSKIQEIHACVETGKSQNAAEMPPALTIEALSNLEAYRHADNFEAQAGKHTNSELVLHLDAQAASSSPDSVHTQKQPTASIEIALPEPCKASCSDPGSCEASECTDELEVACPDQAEDISPEITDPGDPERCPEEENLANESQMMAIKQEEHAVQRAWPRPETLATQSLIRAGSEPQNQEEQGQDTIFGEPKLTQATLLSVQVFPEEGGAQEAAQYCDEGGAQRSTAECDPALPGNNPATYRVGSTSMETHQGVVMQGGFHTGLSKSQGCESSAGPVLAAASQKAKGLKVGSNMGSDRSESGNTSEKNELSHSGIGNAVENLKDTLQAESSTSCHDNAVTSSHNADFRPQELIVEPHSPNATNDYQPALHDAMLERDAVTRVDQQEKAILGDAPADMLAANSLKSIGTSPLEPTELPLDGSYHNLVNLSFKSGANSMPQTDCPALHAGIDPSDETSGSLQGQCHPSRLHASETASQGVSWQQAWARPHLKGNTHDEQHGLGGQYRYTAWNPASAFAGDMPCEGMRKSLSSQMLIPVDHWQPLTMGTVAQLSNIETGALEYSKDGILQKQHPDKRHALHTPQSRITAAETPCSPSQMAGGCASYRESDTHNTLQFIQQHQEVRFPQLLSKQSLGVATLDDLSWQLDPSIVWSRTPRLPARQDLSYIT